jgi:hypothetical protein
MLSSISSGLRSFFMISCRSGSCVTVTEENTEHGLGGGGGREKVLDGRSRCPTR